MTAFAEPEDLLLRYDYRLLGQLLADDDEALDEAAVLGSSKTATLLEDASGEIIAYAMKGERYSEADLLALTGNGLALLKRLTCDVALYMAVCRRGLPVENYPRLNDSLVMLEQMSQGKVIFPILANAEAGHAASPPITIETIVSQNLLTNSVRYFPTPRWTSQQAGG